MGHLQRLLLATALGLSVMPAAQAQLPSGPSVRSGRVGIQRSGKELIIRSASQRSVINWNRFSIGPDQIVTYYQPSRSATVLNQVTSGVRSVIRGLMQSCLSAGGECRPTQGRGQVGGGVILVNPAGISVLGGQIITDHTLLTTAGINVQEFISSGVINLTLAGDGLIEIGQGATLSGPLRNPSGLEGLSVVAPRIVVDGSVNIPEASSFIVQPQAKGTTEFVFNNVRPSRSFLKLDPGVHHSGISTVHEESDRTRYFQMNGGERTKIPWVGPPDGCVENGDCYAVTEHLTTDSTLEREFPLKTYTVAMIPTIPSSLWSVAPWAITSTRLETPERPPGIEPSQGCEPNGGENGTGEAVCVRDSLKRFQRQEKELLTPESSLVSLQTAEKPELQLQTTIEGRVFLTRSSSEVSSPEQPEEPVSSTPRSGDSCPAQPGLQQPQAPLQSPETVRTLLLQTLIAGGLVNEGSQIVPGSMPPLESLCNGDGQTVQVQEPDTSQLKTVEIGGCLQLTAVRSGCESEGGAPQQQPGAINFTLGSSTPTNAPACDINNPETCLGHLTDPSPVTLQVTASATTQQLDGNGQPIAGCGSAGTLIAPLPQRLWQNLLSGTTKISTDPAGAQFPKPNAPAEGGERQGQLQSFNCNGLNPVDSSRPAHLQNILQAPRDGASVGSVLSCTYKESCLSPGLSRIQSQKIFKDTDGNVISDARVIQRLINTFKIQVQEGSGFNPIRLTGGAAQTSGAVVPAGQRLQLQENSASGTVRWGGKTYSPTSTPAEISVDPGGAGNSFVPEAGREYVVTYTNQLQVNQPQRPAQNQERYVYPCLEIYKTGCDAAQLRFEPNSALRPIYGGAKNITMLPNGGPHRLCPLRRNFTSQRSGSIVVRERNATDGTKVQSPLQGLSLQSGRAAGGTVQVRGVPAGQGQPAPLKLTFSNPECAGGPGTTACVKFEKQWIGTPPANAGSPLIRLQRLDTGESLTVSQESGTKCYAGLQPGQSIPVKVTESLNPSQRDIDVVQQTDQATIVAGQGNTPTLQVVNRARDGQRCIRLEKRLEVQGQSQQDASQAFDVRLTTNGRGGTQVFDFSLTPGQPQTKCLPQRQLQSFAVTEADNQNAKFAHYQTVVNGAVVAAAGQPMQPKQASRNNAVTVVNVPKTELVGKACLEVEKVWLRNGQSVSPQDFPGVSAIKIDSNGQLQNVLPELKSNQSAQRCQQLRQGETWKPQVQEVIKPGSQWQPSLGAIQAASRQSANVQAQEQSFTPSVASSGNTVTVSGLNIIAGNTDRVTLVNEYRPSVSVPAGKACLRVRKLNVGQPPAGATQVGLEFISSVPLSIPDAQGALQQQPGAGAPYSFKHQLDLTQGSYAPIVCYQKSNFSGDIELVETLPSGVIPDAVTPKPNANGKIVISARDLQAGRTLDLSLENNYYQRPPEPVVVIPPEPQVLVPPKQQVNEPTPPSCVTVKKTGEVPGQFDLQVSAGSQLTQGAKQFVLSPKKSQTLCAVSPDKSKPVQFVVSETPAPGVLVSGVAVNGQQQAVVGGGTGTQTAQVSVAPNGTATLSFENNKVPTPPSGQTPPPSRNQPPTGTTTQPVPVRHQRYDADTQTFVFVIPGQAPRFVELEDLPGVITVNGIRYRLLKPDVVRGL